MTAVCVVVILLKRNVVWHLVDSKLRQKDDDASRNQDARTQGIFIVEIYCSSSLRSALDHKPVMPGLNWISMSSLSISIQVEANNYEL
jgi:hypothetical protein